jgi:hypothetical protein
VNESYNDVTAQSRSIIRGNATTTRLMIAVYLTPPLNIRK